MALSTNPSTAGDAQVTKLERAELQIEGDEKIECWFNPKEYTVSKQNEWKVDAVVGSGLPKAQFGGGQACELAVELLFDASDDPTRSVAAICAQLFGAMEVRPEPGGAAGKNSKRPPYVTFSWGKIVSFQAVVRQLSVQYVLFRADGAPIRALTKLSLLQVAPAPPPPAKAARRPATPLPPQNPTTRGTGGERAHVLEEGEVLQTIAFACYGDATRWRLIAEANDIDDPLRLPRSGTSLLVPRAAS